MFSIQCTNRQKKTHTRKTHNIAVESTGTQKVWQSTNGLKERNFDDVQWNSEACEKMCYMRYIKEVTADTVHVCVCVCAVRNVSVSIIKKLKYHFMISMLVYFLLLPFPFLSLTQTHTHKTIPLQRRREH